MALTKAKLESLLAAGDVDVALANIATDVTGTTAQAMMDHKLELVTLWTNSTPTASFAAQTVAVDLTGFDGVIVAYVQRTGEQTLMESAFLPKGVIAGKLSGYYYRMIAMRTVTAISNAGVTFANAGYAPTYGSDNTTNNECIIPWRIYGVAGVQA